jgi:hypothetical protein
MTLLSNDCDFSLATISGNGSWVDWCAVGFKKVK